MHVSFFPQGCLGLCREPSHFGGGTGRLNHASPAFYSEKMRLHVGLCPVCSSLSPRAAKTGRAASLSTTMPPLLVASASQSQPASQIFFALNCVPHACVPRGRTSRRSSPTVQLPRQQAVNSYFRRASDPTAPRKKQKEDGHPRSFPGHPASIHAA